MGPKLPAWDGPDGKCTLLPPAFHRSFFLPLDETYILYYSQKDWTEIEGIKPCHLISLQNELHRTDLILKTWATVWFKWNEADYSEPSTRIWLVSTDKLSNKLWLKHFMIGINKSGGFILVESFHVTKQISMCLILLRVMDVIYTVLQRRASVYIPTHETKKMSTSNIRVL